MIVDLVFDEPGVYALVNHDYAATYTGAATLFVAGDPFGLNEQLGVDPPVPSYAHLLGNPMDAVPPSGMNSIDHPKLNAKCMCTDERAAEMAAERGI